MNEFFAEFFGTAMIIVFGGGVCSNVMLIRQTVITAA
jgi:glycerol uptake facilitator-like aquaporin